MSKLALNSFYGKFGQRTNMKKTKYIQDIGEFINIFTDKSKIVTDFHIMNNDVMMLEYYNRVVHKHYCVVYDKRIVLDNFTTVPYGYRF